MKGTFIFLPSKRRDTFIMEPIVSIERKKLLLGNEWHELVLAD